MKFKTLLTLLILTFALCGVAAAENWIHMRVEGDDDEEVTVNLPVCLVSAAAAMIPAEVNEEARIEIDDLDMDWNELMAFWQAVRDSPEATFVTVETRDETVKVRKEGNYLLVKTTEMTDEGDDVDVRLQLSVVDALLSGPEGTLDFQAAIDALVAEGTGDLVSIKSDDETMRIGIDDRNESE